MTEYMVFWLKEYKKREQPMQFMDFIGLVRGHSIKPSYVRDCYKAYFDDHPDERHRLTGPIKAFLSGEPPYPGYFVPYGGHLNAWLHVQVSCEEMLKGILEHEDFDEMWESKVIQDNMLLRIPEDDKLEPVHILGRTHIVLCHVHNNILELEPQW